MTAPTPTHEQTLRDRLKDLRKRIEFDGSDFFPNDQREADALEIALAALADRKLLRDLEPALAEVRSFVFLHASSVEDFHMHAQFEALLARVRAHRLRPWL